MKKKLLFTVMAFLFLLTTPCILSQPLPTFDSEHTGVFRASVVKVDVTPAPGDSKWLLGYGPRESTGIRDHIYHRIVALDDGVTQFFLVQSDFCVMSPSQYDHVAAMLQRELGIDPLNFWWSLSHTHSAPELGVPGLPEVFMGDRYRHEVDTDYESFVARSLVDGIIEARSKLVSARLGVGWGFSMANMNRRAIDENGKASLGMNPDLPVDRRIGLIRLDKEDGTPIALIANYAMHGTVFGPDNTEISADAQGVVAEYVEQKTGAPMLYINGAAGNIAPIYSVYPNTGSGYLNQFKLLLGDKILEANKKIVSTTNKVKLFSSSMILETPRKANLGWPSDLGKYTRTTKFGANKVRLPVRFLKINEDVAIWSLPVELFCEISNEIRDYSPFPYTFYYGYTNGWLGYLPTEKAFQHGGYEVEVVSPYTPSGERDLKESVVGYLQGEMRSIKTYNDKTNIVNRPQIVQTDADGSLRLTARKGYANGPEIKYMPEWAAFGWFTSEDRVDWHVDVEKAGNYEVILEWSVSDEEAGKEFLLKAKGQKLTGIVAPSGSWETFRTEKVGSINLKEGRQKIMFGPNKHFDKGALLDLREIKLRIVKSQ